MHTTALAAAGSLEAWAEWLTMKRAMGLCSMASLYPLVMSIQALRNGGGGHWHCLWILAVIGIFLRFFTSGGDMFTLGVIWLLFGAFVFYGQRELHQMTD
ncbi:hypothetical protein [Prosthecobacter sp.]|uniref:hypothetical protein n=1 Tax=Prosthecobacter sp. TaxID=1965333 RepID=UPI003784A91F